MFNQSRKVIGDKIFYDILVLLAGKKLPVRNSFVMKK